MLSIIERLGSLGKITLNKNQRFPKSERLYFKKPIFITLKIAHLIDIYAMNYGDGLMVKRLKLVPRTDQVSVNSDNEHYGTDNLPRDDIRVYGRIVGWFQVRG